MAQDNNPVEIWARELAATLQLSDVRFDVDDILDLAGVAAHSVVRPAAPLTTFLLGVALGRATVIDSVEASTLDELIAEVRAALEQRQ